MMTKMPAPSEQPYSLMLEGRKRAEIIGVEDVESFDETAVVLHTHGGKLILSGKGLHVSSLQLENGRMTLEGAIDGAVYQGQSGARRGFWRRALG